MSVDYYAFYPMACNVIPNSGTTPKGIKFDVWKSTFPAHSSPRVVRFLYSLFEMKFYGIILKQTTPSSPRRPRQRLQNFKLDMAKLSSCVPRRRENWLRRELTNSGCPSPPPLLAFFRTSIVSFSILFRCIFACILFFLRMKYARTRI